MNSSALRIVIWLKLSHLGSLQFVTLIHLWVFHFGCVYCSSSSSCAVLLCCHNKPFLSFFLLCAYVWLLPEKPKQTQNCLCVCMYVYRSNWPYITLATIYHIKTYDTAYMYVCLYVQISAHVHHLFSSHPCSFLSTYNFFSILLFFVVCICMFVNSKQLFPYRA